ncbi:MAG: lipid IV(A) 3-deoxy-D-manno-octulosonic acid transferase [Gammaproteobacteria bacterium]|jgi:3-deoxy-D-manno-octulosonic-acid transferase|nr:lipid IV(A) 3-deoxy-D-manno-octulosonic acid transferase [Zhongshania sp.]MBU0537905.1 lipid IV(A) 3-deoxy-D-manno-octulosonic acid transferase [Gammaproteobacteria bacterium]MBU1832667.1 lipid IV(A) 3-deoxy-D-manno-octulosonic acid transferase [Gammaproteobacteria bacterium]
MPRFLYSAFFYLILPLVLLRLLWRGWRAPAYNHRIAERFGFFAAPTQKNGLWVHAVSVGESIAAAPIIEHFLACHPQLPVVVTTMTPTGSERVQAMFGDRVFHVYAPYDLPDAVARFLKRVQPSVAVIMETEIWPNMVCQTAARGIPVILANARLSARSARGYGRLEQLTRSVFARFSQVVAQSADDGARFVELGVPAEKLTVSGSIKFDLAIPVSLREQASTLRAQWFGARPVWIAASTHAGEDEILLAAHRAVLQQQPNALLLLVPRHPERFAKVAELIAANGFGVQRRSDYKNEASAAATQVILGDTMGELLLLLGCADIAFVGGSLIEHGGHNTLEPAAWGLPVLSGPSDFNFAEISALLQAAGGLVKLADSGALALALQSLFADPERAQQQGAVAKQVVDSNRGALQRLLVIIEKALQEREAV